jgi:hypothetical protein
LELLFEILIQITVMFLGIFYINRIVTFIPTFSEQKYPDYNVMITVLPILLITLSLQTKLGEKVSILTDRLYDAWEGNTNDKKKKKKKQQQQQQQQIKVSQPLSDNFQTQDHTTSISSLPVSQQQSPDFNSMYNNGNEQHHMQDEPQIMAANEFMGSKFGSGF